jgi:hypothetical protein
MAGLNKAYVWKGSEHYGLAVSGGHVYHMASLFCKRGA